jgi:hypothetical protein
MNAEADLQSLILPAETLHSVVDVAGLTLTCRQGSLWITVDHDLRDIVLEPGQSFRTDQHRRALVYAFEPSLLALRAREATNEAAVRLVSSMDSMALAA